MLVVIEGPDGAGKSTLAHQLADEILHQGGHVHMLHAVKPMRTAYEEYQQPLEDYRPGDGQHYIIDRWHVGELVYGPLRRGSLLFTHTTWNQLEEFLVARGALLVHLDAALKTLRKRRPDETDLVQQQLYFRNAVAYSRLATTTSRDVQEILRQADELEKGATAWS